MSTSMIINLLLIGIVLVGASIVFLLTLNRSNTVTTAPPKTVDDRSKYTIPKMVEYVRKTLNEIVSGNLYDLGLDEEDLYRRQRKREELRRALKNCNTGNIHEKTYVKDYIQDLLVRNYGLNETNINWVIPFDESDDRRKLTVQDKFDILLYIYKKRHGFNALEAMIYEYDLDRPRRDKDDPNVHRYAITALDVEKIYRQEVGELTFEDKLAIVTQRVYQHYKGFGVVDEIRDMNVDGVSGGVSGVPMEYAEDFQETDLFTEAEYAKDTHNSVWIFYRGKSIHLPFLSFGSEKELKRICQNIYKYNNPGQLSETRGYIVNDMYDKSRVVVVRPKFAESWAFFVRKFHLPKFELDRLIVHENAEIVINFLKYLMKGCRITAITGEQGSGKTSLMMALVKYIDPTYNLRVQEMTFEVNLRRLYPDRNILSFRETEYISGQEGLDLQKKTDGTVNIIGEVATDPVGAWMIQAGQVASRFTIFSHHAKTFDDLIFSLRNSLLKTGMFNDEKIAEQQVVNVINFDVHLVKDHAGNRYIERITECIPTTLSSDYPKVWQHETDPERRIQAFMETMTEFFTRMTDRKTYIARDIIVFDNDNRCYKAVDPISHRSFLDMAKFMSDKDRAEFEQFVNSVWGPADVGSGNGHGDRDDGFWGNKV